jgi:hypothetical protein
VKQFQGDHFKTLGDYFGSHKEHKYFRCLARDDPTKRQGIYFILALSKAVTCLPKDASAKIYIMTDLKSGIQEFRCKIPDDSRYPITWEIHCGLTSKQIDFAKIKAWRVEIVDADNNILCDKQSYLWNL